MNSTPPHKWKGRYLPSSMLAACTVLLIVFAAVGCQNTGDKYMNCRTWKRRDINVFINGHKINYYRSTFADVHRAFGRSASVFTMTRNELGNIKRADFIGTAVDFAERTGRILSITTEADSIRIAGDLGIGSRLDQIESHLKNGILSPDGTTFMFLLEAQDGAYGDGYLISLNESKQVTEIYLGRVPHGP